MVFKAHNQVYLELGSGVGQWCTHAALLRLITFKRVLIGDIMENLSFVILTFMAFMTIRSLKPLHLIIFVLTVGYADWHNWEDRLYVGLPNGHWELAMILILSVAYFWQHKESLFTLPWVRGAGLTILTLWNLILFYGADRCIEAWENHAVILYDFKPEDLRYMWYPSTILNATYLPSGKWGLHTIKKYAIND